MTNAKELIAFLAYWATEMAPEREDIQSVPFSVSELKAVLREATKPTDAYLAYCAAHPAKCEDAGPDTSAEELIGYTAYNEMLLHLDEIFDPPSPVSFTLAELEDLRQEILSNAVTYQYYRAGKESEEGGCHVPS